MEMQDKIKKYIGPNPVARVIAILLCVATVVTLAVGIVVMNSANQAEATVFIPDENESNTPVYLDVVGVSGWVVDYDGAVYYSAEDAEGYLYTIRLNGSTYNDMTAQQEYWMRETEDVAMPEAYRVTGTSRKLASNIKTALAESWELTEVEFTQYFGDSYIDTTSSAGLNKAVGWFIAAMMCGVFGLVLLVSVITTGSQTKKTLQLLEEQGKLREAAAQLDAEDTVSYCSDKGRLSRDFLFGKSTGIAVPCSRILWAYQQTQKRGLATVNTYLVVSTPDRQKLMAVNVGKNDRYGEIQQMLQAINQRNPRTMLGYTGENAKMYKAMVKAEK